MLHDDLKKKNTANLPNVMTISDFVNQSNPLSFVSYHRIFFESKSIGLEQNYYPTFACTPSLIFKRLLCIQK